MQLNTGLHLSTLYVVHAGEAGEPLVAGCGWLWRNLSVCGAAKQLPSSQNAGRGSEAVMKLGPELKCVAQAKATGLR